MWNLPGVCSDSCPLSQGCYLTISSSAVPFSFYLQSFSASGSFPMSWLFALGWPKYWSFSFSISPSSEHSGLISFRIHWVDLIVVQGILKSPLAPQFKASILSHIHTWPLEKSWLYSIHCDNLINVCTVKGFPPLN